MYHLIHRSHGRCKTDCTVNCEPSDSATTDSCQFISDLVDLISSNKRTGEQRADVQRREERKKIEDEKVKQDEFFAYTKNSVQFLMNAECVLENVVD